MKKIVILICMFTTIGFLQAQDKHQSIKKELERLSWEWMNAWKELDTAFIDQMMAPEFRLLAIINGELITMTRSEWMKTTPFYIPTTFKYYNFDIRIYGKTAIVQSMFDLEATLHGQDRSGTFQVTDVWVKKSGGWQVVHRHTNLKPKA